MVKIAEIISKVEHIREGGESIPKFQVKTDQNIREAIRDFKSSIDRKWTEENKPKVQEPKNPTLEALGRLQDSGLGQKQPDLPEAVIIGKG